MALSRKAAPGQPAKKKVLPKVVPTSAFYSTIHSQAAQRREARLQARQRLRQDPSLAAQVCVGVGWWVNVLWVPGGVGGWLMGECAVCV